MVERNKQNGARVDAEVWKKVLKSDGEVVLSLALRRPRFLEACVPSKRMERYYQRMAQLWQTRWEGKLYADACAELQARRARSLPFQPWEAALDFTVTYHENGLLSLYCDAYEHRGGAHGNTVRQGDTWSLLRGTPCSLATALPHKCRQPQLVAAIEREIDRRISAGQSLYYEVWRKAVVAHFDPARFYLTTQGLTLFYPLFTLAPYAEGIPTFLIEKKSDP